MGWKESLEEDARGKGHLEEGESIQEAVVADSGRPIGGGAGEARHDVVPFKKRIVVVATERNVYLMTMPVFGSKSDDVVFKVPLAEAEVDVGFLAGSAKVGRRDDRPAWDLRFSGLRRNPKTVASYIEQQRGTQQ